MFGHVQEHSKVLAIRSRPSRLHRRTSIDGQVSQIGPPCRHRPINAPLRERRYVVTDASVHDSQEFDALVTQSNTCADVYADRSAYRSAETEAKLRARGLRSRIHQRASRGHALSKAQHKANREKSKIRARIEHVFGAQQTSPGGRIVRTIGIMRAKAKIGLQNLAYNIRRLVTLERLAAA
jgi:IS5 family transposase